jgi:hypothetical protein
MKAEFDTETGEVNVFIEERDMCKSCQKAYRCSLITSIKNCFVYMASSRNFIDNCWDWQPYDVEDAGLAGIKVV